MSSLAKWGSALIAFMQKWTWPTVSHHLWLTFILNSYMKLAVSPQFMVLFVGFVHIFMFSLIFLSKHSHFCELMWINFSFKPNEEKVFAAGVSLSEVYALSEWHPLSEALSPLSAWENPRRGSIIDARAQRAASSPNESFVPSRAQRAKLTEQEFTNSRLARKWR